MPFFTMKLQWIEEVVKSYEGDIWAAENLTETLIHLASAPKMTVTERLLRYKQKLYIGVGSELRGKLTTQLHV